MVLNPIDANWGGNKYSQGGGSSAFSDIKTSAAEGLSGVKARCCDSCCSDEVKDKLVELVEYSATIIIALAWYAFLGWGIFYRVFDYDNLLMQWVFAAICIILAMILCFLTGETLAFGEDCC
ncbi:hypothetical protein DIPPA_06782 [Diplonema papillatum]|nr:hypothetical protein DIPPA_06782 [Diplonema papillatum]